VCWQVDVPSGLAVMQVSPQIAAAIRAVAGVVDVQTL
jgi:hypothetical protein